MWPYQKKQLHMHDINIHVFYCYGRNISFSKSMILMLVSNSGVFVTPEFLRPSYIFLFDDDRISLAIIQNPLLQHAPPEVGKDQCDVFKKKHFNQSIKTHDQWGFETPHLSESLQSWYFASNWGLQDLLIARPSAAYWRFLSPASMQDGDAISERASFWDCESWVIRAVPLVGCDTWIEMVRM